jgi:hypothetical protein
LAAVGVSRAESAIFTVIHYGLTFPAEDMPRQAAAEDYAPEDRFVTEAECRIALDACLAKGWVQILDQRILARITADLHAGGFLGPIYGMPDAGCVDFTETGAELWRRLGELRGGQSWPPFAYTDCVREKAACYFRSRQAAVTAIEKIRSQEDVVSVSEPTPIGPWRVQWWRQFPEGSRVDVEERRQWQGRCGTGGETVYLASKRSEGDLPRLRDILDRHNVTLAEWTFLATLEQGPDRPSWLLRRFGESKVGVSFTDEERGAALDACLRNGWLRVVDEAVLEEINLLLRNEPALLAVPEAAAVKSGDFDFSPTGAALYRMISAEWLGADWEDCLCVSNVYYWEEHHYSEDEAGFDDRNGCMNPDTVRARRVVPIGPWCVYWWERFPSGFRMELECGEDQVRIAARQPV